MHWFSLETRETWDYGGNLFAISCAGGCAEGCASSCAVGTTDIIHTHHFLCTYEAY